MKLEKEVKEAIATRNQLQEQLRAAKSDLSQVSVHSQMFFLKPCNI
jgi:hypothetical protein